MTSFQLIVSLLPISNSITQGRYLKKSSLLKIMSKGQDPLVRDIGTKELRMVTDCPYHQEYPPKEKFLHYYNNN